MPELHKEILTKEQEKLLPFLSGYSKEFGLVGGTAIALYLGHRRSIDFDLFSGKEFGNKRLMNSILKYGEPDEIIVNRKDELTFVLNKVKFTFFYYPFNIDYAENFSGYIKMPDLLTLAAMKAFALGMRAKWKDYVDLYFILRDYFSMEQVSKKAEQLFEHNFNEKLFRSQLAYFEGINYSEQIEFLPGFEVPEDEIKKFLVNASLS